MDSEKELAAAWSAIVEPGDRKAGALLAALGLHGGLKWMQAPTPSPLEGLPSYRTLHARTHPRAQGVDPNEEIRRAALLGGDLLWRGHPLWPSGLAVLGEAEPVALWYRGNPELLTSKQIAIVGARASTAYGNRMAEELAGNLAAQGTTIVSGGAYGIDAAAHRGALTLGTTTAVLCGGLGNLYPKGNERLLEEIARTGLLVTEVPPAFRPARWRFIERNRVIAALSLAVIVVEAGMRSGAMATANRAADIGVDVGAVPGPVTSATSAGTNALIREGAALIRDPADIAEMLGESVPPESGMEEDIDPIEQRVWDALPMNGGADVHTIVVSSGLAANEVEAALVGLRLRSAVSLEGMKWRRR